MQASVADKEPQAVYQFLYPERFVKKEHLLTEALSLPLQPVHELDIDKKWHRVHFLLNGKPWEGEPPFWYVVLGGEPLGDEDMGYGPARYLTPAQVKEAADALDGLHENELFLRFDPAAFVAADIYGFSKFRESKEEAFASMWEYIVAMQDFFRRAADNGEAILLWMS